MVVVDCIKSCKSCFALYYQLVCVYNQCALRVGKYLDSILANF